MKTIKNMRELELMKENLKYQQILTEKNLLSSSATIVDNFTDGIKTWAFEWGTSVAMKLIFGAKKDDANTEDTAHE